MLLVRQTLCYAFHPILIAIARDSVASALRIHCNSLLVLMHRDALLTVPVNFPPSFSIVAFTSSLFRDSFPRVRIFMLDNGFSGMEEQNCEAGLLARKGRGGAGSQATSAQGKAGAGGRAPGRPRPSPFIASPEGSL